MTGETSDRGSVLSLLTVRMYSPVDVLTFTTRTKLSGLLYAYDTRAKGHCEGATLSSMTYTTSPTLRLQLSFLRLLPSWRADTYSFFQRFQKWHLGYESTEQLLSNVSNEISGMTAQLGNIPILISLSDAQKSKWPHLSGRLRLILWVLNLARFPLGRKGWRVFQNWEHFCQLFVLDGFLHS